MKKQFVIIILAMMFLLAGCGKSENNETTDNSQTTQNEESEKQTAEEFFYEGVVDTDSLYLVYEDVWETEGKAQRAYITLPSSMEAVSFDDLYEGSGLEQVEAGTQFSIKGRDDVKIEIYTTASQSNLANPTKSYASDYGQTIHYNKDCTVAGAQGGIVEDGVYSHHLSMRDAEENWHFEIYITCPEEWMEENYIMVDNFIQSLVVVDETNHIIK